MEIDLSKYESSVYNSLDKDNIIKIINFLEKNNCTYIDELLEDYLDIFTFEYDNFVNKYNMLNKKYSNNLIDEISNDMNILEEFYNC